MQLRGLWLTVILFVVAACAPIDLPTTAVPISPTVATPAPTSAPSATPTQAPVTDTARPTQEIPPGLATVPPTAEAFVGELPAALDAQIRADVEARAGVSISALSLIRAEAVTWPDGALGCPQMGMLYTQQLVEGYWVVWQTATGQEFDYRASQAGEWRLCEQQRFKPDPKASPLP